MRYNVTAILHIFMLFLVSSNMEVLTPIALLFCAALKSFVYTATPPTIHISSGDVIGFQNGAVSIFLGIPFAARPVGVLRFQPPKPPTAWSQPLSALQYSKRCMQSEISPFVISEDCLYLNVFTPNISGKYPVMVWIHGGGYTVGSAADFPDDGIVQNLANRGVVVVSINYRLNIFGFFTTKTADMPGNVGMLDQIAALKWIQQEIAHFGGDRSQVTIFGESAGGSSVSLLTYSPLAKGLFHRAIMQSGTAYATWALNGRRRYVDGSKDIALKFGCTTEQHWKQKDFVDLLNCLQKLDSSLLLAATADFEGNDFFQLPWGPVVDGNFLPDWPENLTSQRMPIPTLLGATHDEWAFKYITMMTEGTLRMSSIDQAWFQQQTELLADPKVFGPCASAVATIFKDTYGHFNQSKVDTSHATWFERIVEGFSDYAVTYPTLKEAQFLLRLSGAKPVYLYSLDFVSPNFPSKEFYPGVPHLADMYYLFDASSSSEFPWLDGVSKTADDKFIAELLGIAWTNFAKTGNPNPLPQSAFGRTVEWDPIADEKSMQFLSIKPQPQMQKPYKAKADSVWGRVVPNNC